MRRIVMSTAFIGALGALTMMGGCASIDDVKKAQSTADQALSSANAAQQSANQAQSTASQALSAANAAQQSADRANAGVADLNGRAEAFKEQMQKRRGEHD